MIQPSLFPSEIPDEVPPDARSVARRQPRTAPRYSPLRKGATDVGQLFALPARPVGWLKTFVGRPSIDYCVGLSDMWRATAHEPWEALGFCGGVPEAPRYVRKVVRVLRKAIKEAQEAGMLLRVPFKAYEISHKRNAVCAVASALVKDPRERRRLAKVIDAACFKAGLTPDCVLFLFPSLVKPDEWQDLTARLPEREALREAMVLTDKRMTAQIKRAKKAADLSKERVVA